jgi:SAM-dependent methyltransferase
MDPKIMEIGGELQKLLGDCWKTVCITAGINAGFFNILNDKTPVSPEAVAEKFGYDPRKVINWFYFAEVCELIKKSADGYVLDDRGKFFTPGTPAKDLLGFYMANNFILKAVLEAKETFKKNRSIDTLTEGKSSREYQPKVSDNLSALLINIFKDEKINEKDTLLDFGCGHGNFLRTLSKHFAGVKFSGVDANIFAIEAGKKENSDLGLNDRIDLLIGDVTMDMGEFEKSSFDWVTAINLTPYIQVEKRIDVVNNMLRIARKGIFITESIIEGSMISTAGHALLPLLWNDAVGFFKRKEAEDFNRYIQEKYPEYRLKTVPIMQGSTILVIATRV